MCPNVNRQSPLWAKLQHTYSRGGAIPTCPRRPHVLRAQKHGPLTRPAPLLLECHLPPHPRRAPRPGRAQRIRTPPRTHRLQRGDRTSCRAQCGGRPVCHVGTMEHARHHTTRLAHEPQPECLPSPCRALDTSRPPRTPHPRTPTATDPTPARQTDTSQPRHGDATGTLVDRRHDRRRDPPARAPIPR